MADWPLYLADRHLRRMLPTRSHAVRASRARRGVEQQAVADGVGGMTHLRVSERYMAGEKYPKGHTFGRFGLRVR